VDDGFFDHLRLSVTSEEEMVKEGHDVREASEKKQGRKASLRSKSTRNLEGAKIVESPHMGTYLLTILGGLD
jgi:hypothetical protein